MSMLQSQLACVQKPHGQCSVCMQCVQLSLQGSVQCPSESSKPQDTHSDTQTLQYFVQYF